MLSVLLWSLVLLTFFVVYSYGLLDLKQSINQLSLFLLYLLLLTLLLLLLLLTILVLSLMIIIIIIIIVVIVIIVFIITIIVVCPSMIVSLEQAQHLVTTVYDQDKVSLKPRVLPSFAERRRQLHTIVTTTNNDQQALSVR